MTFPMRALLLLALALVPIACQSGPKASDFPFAHPDTARALDRRVSKERYEQRVEQLFSREPEAREEWLARQLWADGLPVWNRPSEFTVAHIPAIDRSKKDFVAIVVSESNAGLILEAAGAWTTAMRAKSLPRPPLLMRFVVCHDDSSPWGWLTEEDEAHFRGALILQTSLMTGDETRGVAFLQGGHPIPSGALLDAVLAGSPPAQSEDTPALTPFDPQIDLLTPLTKQVSKVRPELGWINLQSTPDQASQLVGVALRAVLQLR